MTKGLNLDFCFVDGEVDGVLQLADVRQGGVRHGRARTVVGLSVERFTGRIFGEFARIFKFSGLASVRQSCRKIERDDSSKTDDVKNKTQNTEKQKCSTIYSHMQMLINLSDY